MIFIIPVGRYLAPAELWNNPVVEIGTDASGYTYALYDLTKASAGTLNWASAPAHKIAVINTLAYHSSVIDANFAGSEMIFEVPALVLCYNKDQALAHSLVDEIEYTITFVDEDGTELQSGKVGYGATPEYTGETPTKAADAQYTYTFAGWTPEIAPVTGEATYTATFDKTVNEYTVTFYVNGEVYDEQTVAYGEAAEAPADPEIAGKTFTGWDVEFDNITGDLDVNALFEDVLYTVKVQVAAGAGDSTAVIDGFDGDAKVVNGRELTLIAEAATGYIFDGWYNVTGGYSELLSKETTATYTVDLADATLEARFVEEVIGAPEVDVVVPEIEEGTITTTPAEDGKVEIKVEVSDEEKQVAFWYRETTDGTQIYLGAGESITVPPAGAGVTYMPHFVSKDETNIVVYLGRSEDIIAINPAEVPAEPTQFGFDFDEWVEITEVNGIVTLYKAKYVKAETYYTLTIDYVNAENEERQFQVYDAITATKTADGNVEWVLVDGEGTEKVISNKDNCAFAIMLQGDATLIEREITGEAKALIVGQSVVYDAGAAKIHFSGSYDLPEGATLVGVGVLLADASKVTVQPENINHNTAGVIVGAIKKPQNTNFIITKGKVAAGATWYGRPYLTYTMNGQTQTIYADTMVCTAN